MHRSDVTASQVSETEKIDSPRTQMRKQFPSFFDRPSSEAVRHVLLDVKELKGGLTNRSYKALTLSNEYVARLPGAGSDDFIDRENESHDTQVAFEAGTTAEVVYDEHNGKKITRFIKNAVPMTVAHFKNHEIIEKAATVVAKLHQSPRRFSGDVDVFARNKRMLQVLSEREYNIPEKYHQVAKRFDDIEALFDTFSIVKVPCHNDTTPSNLILADDEMLLIDFEYGGNNDPVWDLACLSMEAEFTVEQDQVLLRAYYGGEVDPDVLKRFALYKPVVEYWVGLWCLVRLSGLSKDDDEQVLRDMEAVRFQRGLNLLESDEVRACLQPARRVTFA